MNGQLSNALKQKLADESLLDMEVIFRYRGIHTQRALESMQPSERTVFLSTARKLYELLGIFPTNVKNMLNRLFGNVPQQSKYQGSPWAMQAGTMPFMHLQPASHSSWSHRSVPSQPELLTDA